MTEILYVMLLLAAWVVVSVGGASLWGNHCRQGGWREGFDDGFDEGARFATELRREVTPWTSF